VLGVQGDLPAIAPTISRLFNERYRPDHHVPICHSHPAASATPWAYKSRLVSIAMSHLEAIVQSSAGGFLHLYAPAGQASVGNPTPPFFTKALALAGLFRRRHGLRRRQLLTPMWKAPAPPACCPS
jgi:hypothetical protein